MDLTQDQLHMIQRIAYMEEANAKRRRQSPLYPEATAKRTKMLLEAELARFPPLPEPLPRPEYAVHANSLSLDLQDVEFYLACESGKIEKVKEFVETNHHSLTNHASKAILEYGLEQAAFGLQGDVVRFLLAHGVKLHSNMFERSVIINRPGTRRSQLFEISSTSDVISLLQIYIEFGWHPNQAWLHDTHDMACFALNVHYVHHGGQIMSFLLDQGANPGLQPYTGLADGLGPVNREGAESLRFAIRTWDILLLKKMMAHGADLTRLHPLLEMNEPFLWSYGRGKLPTTPFAERRPMAEYLLSLYPSEINATPTIYSWDFLRAFADYREQVTALSVACASEDWEYAEWLLEKGADPNLLDGKALQPQEPTHDCNWWSDPTVIRKLVEKRKEKGRSIGAVGRTAG